jgi:hypothetical protein
MANQFTTGQGQGMGPTSVNPQQRTLGSGVNAGQGLPNMDPNKMGNPYASAAQSIGTNVANPTSPPNPYGGGAQPRAMVAPGNPAQPQAPGQSATPQPATPAAPAPTRPPVPSQAMGQPPNPYIARAMPAAQTVAQNVTQTPMQTQQGNAMAAAGVAPGTPTTPMQPGQFAPNLNSNYTAPGSNYTTFNPQQYNAFGGLLASEAAGNLTPAQVLANKSNFANQYYQGAMGAANQSAGQGLTGDSGQSREMQQNIAGNIAAAQTQANAQLQQEAQRELGGMQQANLGNMQFAQGLGQSQQELQQNAQNAFNNANVALAGQANQANIAQADIQQKQNQPFWNQAGTVAANIVGNGLKYLPTLLA